MNTSFFLSLRSWPVMLAMALLTGCSPSSEAAASDTELKLKQAFTLKYPDHEVLSVRPSPMSGVYEIVTKNAKGRNIVYSDATLNYLLVGDLIDMKRGVSLTEEKMSALNVVRFADLPLDQAIKEVRGKGERSLVVFSDPDCPFCKKLERESIPYLENVTIYTFLYPSTRSHPDAEHKSKAIWCAPNRSKAWTDWMRHDQLVAKTGSCSTPIKTIQTLAQQLNIQGTPALIFQSGKVVPGAIPLAAINELLNEAKQ